MRRLAFEGIRRALSNRSYRLYAAGSSISLIGFWLQKVAVGWLTWELTQSGTWLGIVAIADALPATVLAPLSGVLADRFERIRLIRLTQFAQSTQAATLATLSYTGLLRIETLVALVIVLGVIQVFAQPVRLSLVPSLVRVEDLSSAVALNSSLFNLARFIGPAIAAFLITAFGVAASFAGAALCFFVFLIIMFRIEPLRNEVTTGRRGTIWSDVVEGLRYAAAHPGVRPILMLIIATTVFSRSFFDLLPAFADRVFERGRRRARYTDSFRRRGRARRQLVARGTRSPGRVAAYRRELSSRRRRGRGCLRQPPIVFRSLSCVWRSSVSPP